MALALELASEAATKGEVPVGTVIVERASYKIIATAHNMVQTLNNPLMHAEIIAINQACAFISNKNLSAYDIYSSLEPCAMCAGAISLARINRLFYAAPDYKAGAVEHGITFFNSTSCFHRPEIYPGLFEKESKKLLKDFFCNIRFI